MELFDAIVGRVIGIDLARRRFVLALADGTASIVCWTVTTKFKDLSPEKIPNQLIQVSGRTSLGNFVADTIRRYQSLDA